MYGQKRIWEPGSYSAENSNTHVYKSHFNRVNFKGFRLQKQIWKRNNLKKKNKGKGNVFHVCRAQGSSTAGTSWACVVLPHCRSSSWIIHSYPKDGINVIQEGALFGGCHGMEKAAFQTFHTWEELRYFSSEIPSTWLGTRVDGRI